MKLSGIITLAIVAELFFVHNVIASRLRRETSSPFIHTDTVNNNNNNQDRNLYYSPVQQSPALASNPYGFSAISGSGFGSGHVGGQVGVEYGGHASGFAGGFAGGHGGGYGALGGGYGGGLGGGYGGGLGGATSYFGGLGNYFNGGYGVFNLLPIFIVPLVIVLGLFIFFPFAIQIPSNWGTTAREAKESPYGSSMGLMQRVLNAIENEDCLRRTACDAGVYAKSLGGFKEFVFSTIDSYVPAIVAPYLEIVKESSRSSDSNIYCRRYACGMYPNPPGLNITNMDQQYNYQNNDIKSLLS